MCQKCLKFLKKRQLRLNTTPNIFCISWSSSGVHPRTTSFVGIHIGVPKLLQYGKGKISQTTQLYFCFVADTRQATQMLINNDIRTLSNLANSHSLKSNPGKTHFMLFGNKTNIDVSHYPQINWLNIDFRPTFIFSFCYNKLVKIHLWLNTSTLNIISVVFPKIQFF